MPGMGGGREQSDPGQQNMLLRLDGGRQCTAWSFPYAVSVKDNSFPECNEKNSKSKLRVYDMSILVPSPGALQEGTGSNHNTERQSHSFFCFRGHLLYVLFST